MRPLLFLLAVAPCLADSALHTLARLLPPSCGKVMGVSGEALRKVPSASFYLMFADGSGSGFGDLIATAGFDPKRDMEEFISCGKYPDLVIVRGTFDRQRFGFLDRMRGERKEIAYRDFPVSLIEREEDEPTLWTALVRGHVVIGSPFEVKDAIDRLLDGAPPLPLLPEIERARKRFDAWLHSTGGQFARVEIDPKLGFGEGALEPFERTQGFTAGVTLSGSPTVLLELKAVNEADAKGMATVIRMVLEAKRQEIPAVFHGYLDRVTMWASGDVVSASYTATVEDFERLLLISKQH